MAGQSITFDFISRGGPELARQFKNTGDNAAAAARGAKVLQDTIGRLGEKENRTAAESATLAKALRLTGDAEDRAAAKALGADIAIRRLADAEADAAKKAGGAKVSIGGLAGEITGFGAATTAASSKSSMFARALAGINLASGVLEPALAGVAVAAGGLASGLAAAGAGLGVFGVVAKSVVTEASKAATAYAAAQAKMSAASTPAQRAAALKAEQAAMAGLSPAVKTLAGELGHAQGQWKKFTDAAAPGVVSVIGQGLGLLPKILADMKPFLAPVETALHGIIGQLNTGLSSAGFKSFIDLLAKNTGPAITKIATAVGNVVVGIGGILRAFMPTSQVMLGGIDKITAKFREWGTTLSSHTGFQSLMATFKEETPQAVGILKNLGEVIANVGKAMFGLSSFSNSKMLLNMLTPLSGVMVSLSRNTDLVRIAMYGLMAVKIGQQFSWVTDAWKGIVKFAAATEGATIAQTIAAAATRAWGLAMDALPWVALAAAVIAVAAVVIKYHTQIWHFMIRVWDDILHIISGVWGWIQRNWPLLLAIITGPVGLAILWITKHFGDITSAVKTVLDAVKTAWDIAWGALKTAFRIFIVDGVLTPIGWIIDAAAKAFGWIPGLGGKLKDAAKHFGQFKDDVNNSLGGLNGRTIPINVAMTSSTNPYPGGISGRAAAGMYVAQGRPGVDDQLILAQRGEVIVPTGMVRAGEVDHLRGRIPGFAAGGQVGVNVAASAPGPAQIESTLMASVIKLATAFAKTLGGSGQAILSYAMSFLHKVPYVWGGQTPSGWDCSGMVSYVLEHFKLLGGRMDAQGLQSWAKPTGPVPGGMAFYGRPAHHVGLVVDGHTLLSALGRAYGTTLSALDLGDNSGYGIPPGGFGGGGTGGALAGSALQELAYSMLQQRGWGVQWPAFNSLEVREAGWNMTATNPSSGAYGLAQFINGPSEYAQYGGNSTTAAGQLTAMLNYISQRYGDPNGAWAHEIADNWYAAGTPSAAPGWAVVGERGPELVRMRGGEQVIPAGGGYADGGQVGKQGAAWLRAWQTRHGGGFGAAWGPIPVNAQIDAMNAAQHQASVLAGARGLTAAQRRHYLALSADRKARVAALIRERDTERAWRTLLTADDVKLTSWIKAAGTSAALRAVSGGWKSQLARQKATIGNISAMLGLSAAQIAAAQKAGTLGPGGAPLPTVTHTYGGDITNTIGAFLSSVAAPFTGTTVMDRGGWLRPGFNSVYNGTGRPEPVGAARGGGTVRLEVSSGGSAEFDRFMVGWLRKHVKVKGGTGPGATDRAFAAH